MSEDLKKNLIIDATGAKKSVSDVNKELGKTEQLTDDVGKKSGVSWAKIAVGITAAVVAIKSAFSAMSKFVTAANRQENVIRKLNFQFGENADNMREFASEIQRLTKVGDEAAMEMMSLAKSMGASDKNMQEIIKGAIGLSEALGIDVNSAVKMVTAGIEGQDYTLLNRYLPSLRLAKDEAEKTAIFQKTLADGFSLAKEAAQTSSGAFEQFKNKLGDLYEVIGGFINQALNPLIKAGTAFISLLLPNEFDKLSKGIKDSYDRLSELRLELKELTKDQLTKKLNEMIAELAKFEQSTIDSTDPLELFGKTAEEAGNKIDLTSDLIGKYNTDLSENVDLTAKVTTETDAHSGSLKDLNNAQAEGIKKTFDYKAELIKTIEEMQSLIKAMDDTKGGVKGIDDAQLRNIPTTNKILLTLQKVDNEYENLTATLQTNEEIEAEIWEKKKAAIDDYANKYSQVAQSIASAGTALTNYRLQEVDNQYKEEADKYNQMLENNQISKDEYDKQMKILDNKAKKDKREALEAQKKYDIISAVSNTAVGVTKAYSLPFPLNWIQGALVGIAGAIQVATIKAQKFATGGWIRGAGTSTSDSIPIMASNNEFMVNARTANSALPNTTQAIDTFQRTGSTAGLAQAVQRDTGGSGGTTVIQPKASATLAIKGRDLAIFVQQELNQMDREGYDTNSL